ncbi:MAG TPA: hypothetical protein VLH08_21860 [Acidobacteriota bacterium]|nr:hypothetical protein [Acidobacteriota bacterium]
MKKVIVTTTINPPTEAIRKFDEMQDWTLVVIGDLKTPKDYTLKNGIYVDPLKQEEYDRKLSDVIGWNCIQRRNFGFLWAKDLKADIVAVVDDDNIPYESWGKDLMLGQETRVQYYSISEPAFDPVGATNHPNIWHRGFPLQLIPSRNYSGKIDKIIVPDVQADFWNGDPDIDAFCRMEHLPECSFEHRFFPMSSNKLSPFNSQNTFLNGRLLRHYFLFPHVGRMDDIWASYYLQAKMGAAVVYGKPSVYQQRNVHDLVKDMKQEYLGYENNLNIVRDLAASPEAIFKYIPESSRQAFELYQNHF